MGIPPIRPYPMPTAADLPVPVPDWQPHPDRALLLVHDLQRYFVDMFPRGRSPVVELLANVDRLRRTAHRLRIPVVYTAQPGRMSRHRRGLLFDFWGAGMDADPTDRAIVDEVAPRPGDVVVERHRYSAFHDSPLAGLIAGHRRDQLLVCGVYAHVGCLVTACDAFSRDIQPFLVADAVADFTADDHRTALAYAARTCAVVRTTDQVLAALRRPVVAGTELVGAPTGLLLDDPGQRGA
jgi:isochorismate hydrolase